MRKLLKWCMATILTAYFMLFAFAPTQLLKLRAVMLIATAVIVIWFLYEEIFAPAVSSAGEKLRGAVKIHREKLAAKKAAKKTDSEKLDTLITMVGSLEKRVSALEEKPSKKGKGAA